MSVEAAVKAPPSTPASVAAPASPPEPIDTGAVFAGVMPKAEIGALEFLKVGHWASVPTDSLFKHASLFKHGICKLPVTNPETS